MHHQRQRQHGGHQPASESDQQRRGDAGEHHQPLQRQADVLVHVVDPDHEAVVVPHHLVAGQEETQRQRQQEDHRGAAQEPRFEPALQAEDSGIEFRGIAQVGKSVAHLPSARGDPVHQHAHDHQGQHVAAQHGVERQSEQVERERQGEDRVAPGARLAGLDPM